MRSLCPALMVASVSSILAALLSGLVAFGAYNLFSPGWPYFVTFVAGGSIMIAVLSALLSYTISVLLQEG